MGGDSRREQDFSFVVLRGFGARGGSFRRPPAGCVRDASSLRAATTDRCRYAIKCLLVIRQEQRQRVVGEPPHNVGPHEP
jgi:hypothetical protein